MAHTRALQKTYLKLVKAQLGEVLGRFHREGVELSELALCESFELHILGQEAIGPAFEGRDLRPHIQRTGAWMHLVKSQGKAIGLAHSSAAGSVRKNWSVQTFFLTPRAPKLADAIQQLDALRADENIEVQLIALPSYRLEFFLLLDGDTREVYVISCPREEQGIREGEFYSEKDFLEKVSTKPPRTAFLASPAS